LGAVAEAKFGEQAADVRFDGFVADGQSGGDLRVGQSLGYQGEHLDLARCEVAEGNGIGCGSVRSLPDQSCDFDLTKLSLSGVYIGQAAVVVLAVLAVTAEYETGMIRTTLAACPRRAHGGFTAAGGYRSLSLGDGLTLRAYGGTVLYLALVAIMALGIGFVLRHTGGTVTLVLGLLYLAPIITIAVSDPRWREWIQQVSPMTAGLSIQATLRLDALPISPWRGLGVVALYAAASTIAAAAALRFRDA
jgi:ABC-2 type transport system permease protein